MEKKGKETLVEASFEEDQSVRGELNEDEGVEDPRRDDEGILLCEPLRHTLSCKRGLERALVMKV
jgi:hypothetical protein